MLQQRPALIVGPGSRHNRDIHPLGPLDLVQLDLRENGLVIDTDGVIASAIE